MRILAFFAHPDDETFGPGGTLARYAQMGHTTRLITFTRGEAGSLGPAKTLTREELGRLRSLELECAARALHISSNRIYDLPDKKLSGVESETAVKIVRQEIDSFRPDLVITFHSGGISWHPDHQTVARWCLQAVRENGGPRLLGFGISESQARRIGFRELIPIPQGEVTHVVDVSCWVEDKIRAAECHDSQADLWQKIRSIDGGYDDYARLEHFSQAWPVRESGARPAERLED